MAFDEEPEFAAYETRLREILPPHDLDAAWVAGRALSMAEAVGEAVSG
jgi:hypothetical protein